MAEVYRTVAGIGESAFEIRGSRFRGRVAPAGDVPTAESIVAEVRRAHPDATHVVPAYRIRADPFREWASDDGEPRGSAGDPMLQVLAGQELENVVATVVRHYGGTNLGIGGLVRAYTEATTRAIADTDVVDRRPHDELVIETNYDDSGRVRSVLEGNEATIDARYEERVTFHVSAPVAEMDQLRERILDVTSGRAEIEDS